MKFYPAPMSTTHTQLAMMIGWLRDQYLIVYQIEIIIIYNVYITYKLLDIILNNVIYFYNYVKYFITFIIYISHIFPVQKILSTMFKIKKI